MVTAKQPEKPTLGYWKIRGFGSQIRYLLVYLDVDFDEHQYEQGDPPKYDMNSWKKAKDTLGLNFPNLPYYIDGKYRLTEANAIMKYISAKYGSELLGLNPQQVSLVEMVSVQVTDLKGALTMPCYTTGDRNGI